MQLRISGNIYHLYITLKGLEYSYGGLIMEKILYIEEIDGKSCLLLDTDIIECTCFHVGQSVKVKAGENFIEVEMILNE